MLRTSARKLGEELCKAATISDIEVKQWLEKGAPLDHQEKYGTPLHYASWKGNRDIVELLISQGASVDSVSNNGETPLHWASMKGRIDVVCVLVLKGANINAHNKKRQTPLHCACMTEHIDVVTFLVSKGADVNSEDKKKRTPLHFASEMGCLVVVRFLVSQGASINAEDKKGKTPFRSASEKNQIDVMCELRERGASVNQEDKLLIKVLDFADERRKMFEEKLAEYISLAQKFVTIEDELNNAICIHKKEKQDWEEKLEAQKKSSQVLQQNISKVGELDNTAALHREIIEKEEKIQDLQKLLNFNASVHQKEQKKWEDKFEAQSSDYKEKKDNILFKHKLEKDRLAMQTNDATLKHQQEIKNYDTRLKDQDSKHHAEQHQREQQIDSAKKAYQEQVTQSSELQKKLDKQMAEHRLERKGWEKKYFSKECLNCKIKDVTKLNIRSFRCDSFCSIITLCDTCHSDRQATGTCKLCNLPTTHVLKDFLDHTARCLNCLLGVTAFSTAEELKADSPPLVEVPVAAREVKNIPKPIAAAKSVQPIPSFHEAAQIDSRKYLDAQLAKLVGRDDLKEELYGFHDLLESNKIKEMNGLPVAPIPLHLVLTGNPGTGKTTIARILADILRKMAPRLVKSNKFKELRGQDVIAQYVGQTAKVIDDIVAENKHGVIFLDEAYALMPDGGKGTGHQSSGFATDAIAAIMKHMGDPDGSNPSCIWIFAGYKNEMNEFLKMNDGLLRRLPQRFHLRDYTAEELSEIFKEKLKKLKEDLHPPDVWERLPGHIEDIIPKTLLEKTNAGLADQLYDRTNRLRAKRYTSAEKMNNPRILQIFLEEDIKTALKTLAKNEM